MYEKKKPLKAGISEGLIEAVKLVPGLGILIEGVRKYHETIQEEQKKEFVSAISERLEVLEEAFLKEWYDTPEGIETTKKIVATALNAEFSDKMEYFANALFNSPQDFEQVERLKFIEILRNVSKPALIILEAESRLHKQRGAYYSAQVLIKDLVRETKLDPFLVETCVTELYSLGVFSSTTDYSLDGTQSRMFSNGTPAFTEFTKKFIKFIEYP